MGIPVKLTIDGFVYMGEEFAKGEIFDAPTDCFASYLCDQENQATRIDESKLEPAADGGTMKRTMKGGSYNTKVMEPDNAPDKPVVTKTKSKAPTKSKSNVKAKSDAVSENT